LRSILQLAQHLPNLLLLAFPIVLVVQKLLCGCQLASNVECQLRSFLLSQGKALIIRDSRQVFLTL